MHVSRTVEIIADCCLHDFGHFCILEPPLRA